MYSNVYTQFPTAYHNSIHMQYRDRRGSSQAHHCTGTSPGPSPGSSHTREVAPPHKPNSWRPPRTWNIPRWSPAAGPHPPLLVPPYSGMRDNYVSAMNIMYTVAHP